MSNISLYQEYSKIVDDYQNLLSKDFEVYQGQIIVSCAEFEKRLTYPQELLKLNFVRDLTTERQILAQNQFGQDLDRMLESIKVSESFQERAECLKVISSKINDLRDSIFEDCKLKADYVNSIRDHLPVILSHDAGSLISQIRFFHDLVDGTLIEFEHRLKSLEENSKSD